MTSNFTFLHAEWPELCATAQQAERYALPDPRVGCFYARRTLEQLVRWLYDHDSYLKRPDDSSLNSLMDTPEFRDNMTPAVYLKATFIRKAGNRAAHENKRITQYDALQTTTELFHLCYWLAKNYTGHDAPAAGLAFDQTLLQQPVTERPKTSAELQTLAAELKAKDDALRQQQAQNAAFQAEIQRLQAEIAAVKAHNQTIPDTHDYSEAETRRNIIDLLLHEAGWKLDHPDDREFVVTGQPTPGGTGKADYVLWGDDGLPLAVVEAKKTTENPEKGRTQAKLYADGLEQMKGQRPVIFYTNGYDTWLWDDRMYPPRPVQGFYTKDELVRLIQRRTTRKPLKDAQINGAICNRYYQEAAIRHLLEHFDRKHRKGLLVMATGTGKTRVAVAICDLLMRCNWVKKVLFLADRTALVKQAIKAFKTHLPASHPTNLVKEKEARASRVVVSTYHTMLNLLEQGNSKGQALFSAGHFDLVIIDEAHRSVYQKFGAIFRYFDSLLLGLTATPKAEVDRNTYRLFELEPGLPTYAYELETAVADGFLSPPKVISVPLKFQREGIRYADLSEEEKDEWDALEWAGKLPPEKVDAAALNAWLFNADTVDKVLRYLMENGLKVASGDRLGKTIIFARNHDHAKFIQKRFDANYPHVAGHFARVIDSHDECAQTLLEEFDQPQSAPHIAISVDMLDTGVDIEEVLKLVFFKPVRSKTKFIQMIGRGTRLCPDLFGPGQNNTKFYIFDFCENFEFFNEHPQGVEPVPILALSKRLFLQRIALLRALQTAPSDEAILAFRQTLCNYWHREVVAMPPENFFVRPHRRQQEHFARRAAWDALTDADFDELSEHLAGLPTSLPDEDESAKWFDLLLLRLQMAYVMSADRWPLAGSGSQRDAGDPKAIDFTRSDAERRNENVREGLQERVVSIARSLTTSTAQNIPMVRQQLPLLTAIQTDEFWQSITLDMLELVRKNVRNLVQFLPLTHRSIVHTDLLMTSGPGWSWNRRISAMAWTSGVIKSASSSLCGNMRII